MSQLNNQISSQNRFKAEVSNKNQKHALKTSKKLVLGYTERASFSGSFTLPNLCKSQCVKGCPVRVDIPAFIKHIKQKEYIVQSKKLKKKTVYPRSVQSLPPRRTVQKTMCPWQKR
jgi:glutamate synthase (NADPH/NADH) small chain